MEHYGGYINKSLEELKAEFTALNIYVHAATKSCPLGAGSRVVFWVVGDGRRTMFYLPIGWPVVMFNEDFTVNGVHGAANTMTMGGRLKYQHEDEGPWYDLGPVTTSGMDTTLDLPFESTRRSFLVDHSQRSDLVLDELSKAKKSGELDDLFSLGDEFE